MDKEWGLQIWFDGSWSDLSEWKCCLHAFYMALGLVK